MHNLFVHDSYEKTNIFTINSNDFFIIAKLLHLQLIMTINCTINWLLIMTYAWNKFSSSCFRCSICFFFFASKNAVFGCVYALFPHLCSGFVEIYTCMNTRVYVHMWVLPFFVCVCPCLFFFIEDSCWFWSFLLVWLVYYSVQIR